MRVIRKGKKKRPRSTMGAISGGRFKNEFAFQKHVVSRALANQWAVMHQGDSRTMLIGHGFPDLVLVNRRAARIIFAELKMPGGEVTSEQIEWGGLLSSLREFVPQIEYYLWFPRNLHTIEQVLKVEDNPRRAIAFNEAMTQLSHTIKGLAR